MCGISGKYYFSTDKNVSLGLIQEMNKSLFHRGPDDKGVFIDNNIGMGAQRLSIIDLEKGRQPVFNEDKSICSVFNGEVYNYIELRSILKSRNHNFSNESDTEVVPHLYEEFGELFLDKLQGMFALSLWDKKKNLLILARDRVGIKPLYFSYNNDFIIFGSEIKAILKDSDVNRELNSNGINCYLSYGYLPSHLTIFRNISKLLPGHYLVCSNGNIETKKYWQFSCSNRYLETLGVEDKFESLLDESVRKHLRADVPVGLFLSGGLDSSALMYFVNKYQNHTHTFCARFKEKTFDEGEYATYVSKYFGTIHHEVFIEAENCRNRLKEIIGCLDNPIGEPSVLPTYLLADYAKRYVKVAISGEGADELMGGYLTYRADVFMRYYKMLPHSVKKTLSFAADKFFTKDEYLSFSFKAKLFTQAASKPYSQVHYSWREVFSEEDKQVLLSKDYDFGLRGDDLIGKPVDIFLSALKEAKCDTELEKYLYADFKIWLPDSILYRVDAMSMANSMEVRVPYLDHYFVEFVSLLPLRYKIKFFRSKAILKKVMLNNLPIKIIYKNKHGFSVPISNWLKHELKDICLDYLSKDKIMDMRIFNFQYIETILKEYFSGKRDNSRKIWNLLMLSMWYERLKNDCELK